MPELNKMAKNDIEIRRKTYLRLSSQIARLDNAQLLSLFAASDLGTSNSSSWGRNHTIVLGESQVFVKRIPVTDIEYNNLFSTKNLYDLPTYFNYGVGSVGLGVFRELVTHIKTTNWVLEGAIATFPVMYHYRFIPFSGQRGDVDMENHKGFVEYWGNNANIGNYVLDRANANYELVLFIEYIPYILKTWLWENPNELQNPLDDLRRTIGFLKTKGIIHFDAHFHNVLTDGDLIYLSDFGLVLDKSFALTKDEELFFEQNAFYDYGEILWSLSYLIRSSYDLCSDSDKHRLMEKYGIKDSRQPRELLPILLNNIEQIHTDEDLKLNEFYLSSIIKYRSIIVLMHNFYSEMQINNKKDTNFPDIKLRQLLEETGFLSHIK